MDSINDACKFGSDALLELQAFKTRQLNRREKLNRHKNLNQDVISDNIRSLLHDPKTDDLLPIGDNEHYLSDRDLGSVPINSVRLTNKTATSSSSLIDPVRTKDECNSEILNQRASKSNELSISSSRSSTNQGGSIKRRREVNDKDDLESLLSLSSTRERENKKLGQELLELLSKPTAKERNLLERFRSADGYRVQEFCPKGTKGECRRNSNHGEVCDKLHFKKIIAKHTEESLGDCSFLNTCFRMDSCKYVHYEVDYDDEQQQQQRLGNQFKNPNLAETNINKPFHQESTSSTNVNQNDLSLSTNNTDHDSNNNTNRSLTKSLTSLPNFNGPANVVGTSSLTATDSAKYYLSPEEQAQIDAKNRKRFKTVLYPPQWIQCDLRFFDMSLLGKFSVVMADPPWDIHMELPYGTMSDDEMRKLNVPALQDEGVIFLWVTGRAMELGRECLALWGYERCDEIIWVKTNQLQRIIRTGRTGHWLNHGKEHCLVGVKGQPKDINRGLDCDVIVAEVRATSHKPDEIYGIIERLSPGTRKIELFGRAHNVQPNWITLGNQLNGVKLVDPMLVNSFKKLNLPFQTAD